ncbi:hypothetical protein RJ641_003341 [Dillenia turbinata]|uniref:Phosphatidic acid phosphatase type 2/haloperoxidase domain-containing protein n=1 Tax=Dillenia turbinata TaxID=194707 RepID=A0AAN8ZF51_9MAGN
MGKEKDMLDLFEGSAPTQLGLTELRLQKNHKHDWLILLLLAAIEPFRRYVGEDMMSDLKYTMKSDTVPAWAVPLYAVLLPIGVFILFYIRRRDVYDLHHRIIGLLFAVLITGVLTDAIKDAVGFVAGGDSNAQRQTNHTTMNVLNMEAQRQR